MYMYEDFNGLDEGIFLEADLSGTNFYGTAGIDFYNNSQTGHGVTYYSESGGSTTFFNIGFGYHLSRHFNLDLIYFIPNNKVYGFDRIYNDNDTVQNYNKINNGTIFLGCQYSFIF